jgi:predicted TIM-barrel enzyme
MSRVPLPERGQPLDLSYIYQIANAVNELAVQLSPTVGRYTSVDTVNAGTQSVRTSDARIVGGYVVVTNSSSTTADGESSFSYNFADFKFVPVVTATPILTSNVGTDASKDISVVLTRITTNRVEGIVKFNTIGVTDVGVNLIAVGIPV